MSFEAQEKKEPLDEQKADEDGLDYVHGWRLALVETAVLLVIFIVCHFSLTWR